jgi:hypothetical protein
MNVFAAVLDSDSAMSLAIRCLASSECADALPDELLREKLPDNLYAMYRREKDQVWISSTCSSPFAETFIW